MWILSEIGIFWREINVQKISYLLLLGLKSAVKFIQPQIEPIRTHSGINHSLAETIFSSTDKGWSFLGAETFNNKS